MTALGGSRVVTLAGLIAIGTVMAAAPPAAAHVEVVGPGARPGTANATITFRAEAESETAGISQLLVVLPETIRAGDVRLSQAPPGWKLKPDADGYTLAGPPLPAGRHAEHAITVKKLPEAPQLVFKVLQYYSDGKIDRWIQLPQPGIELDAPAPVLNLAPTSAGNPPTASSPASTPPSPGSGEESTAPLSDPGQTDGEPPSSPAGWWMGAAASVLVIGVVALSWLRRRQAGARPQVDPDGNA